MKKTTAVVVLLATSTIILFAGYYYCFNFLHYASLGAPVVATAVLPADCTNEKPVQIDVQAEAAKIESLAADVVPNWTRVQTDAAVHAKAVELADTLYRLRQSNYVSCHSYDGYTSLSFVGHDGYTSLTFVAEQIRRDQGLRLSKKSFPETVMLGNRYTGEPGLIEFWYRGNNTVIEVGWSNLGDESDMLSGYVNHESTQPVLGAVCQTDSSGYRVCP